MGSGYWLWRRQQNVVAAEVQLGHATIEVDARIGIGGSIYTLLLVEMVGFPVRELSILADALAKEVGPKLLEAEIFDAHACGDVLKVNPSCRMKSFMTMGKHAPIVVEGKADLEDCGIFEKIDKTLRETHEVETEEETDTIAGNLQQRHLILHSALERRARLGVDAEYLERTEIVDSTPGFAFALDDNDASAKGVAR